MLWRLKKGYAQWKTKVELDRDDGEGCYKVGMSFKDAYYQVDWKISYCYGRKFSITLKMRQSLPK